MSVFASQRSTHYVRNFGVLLAVAAVVAGTVYFGKVIRDPLTATQIDSVYPTFTPLMALETVFPRPQPVDWEGVIVGVLAGGQGIAVQRHDTNEFFQAYTERGASLSFFEGPIRIRGRLTSISCAYAQTVFNGQCTPTVIIESAEQLTIELE